MRNPVTTPMPVVHQGVGVSFNFPKKEKDSFHELWTMA